MGNTAMNASSSRSHCISRFSIHTPSSQEAGSICIVVCLRSSCCRVGSAPGVARVHGAAKGFPPPNPCTTQDLAGSERTDRTKTEGAGMTEGALINQSLTALGRVVQSLSGAPGAYVPFR